MSLILKDGGTPYRYNCPLEIKELGEAGSFKGYAAVFDNVDLGGDIIMPGAFKKFKLTKDKKLRVLAQHDTWQPVGKSDYEQDDKGLYVEGQLEMGLSYASDVYVGMKTGLLDGLSVGFDILPKGSEYDEDERVRKLTKLELWEYSIVTFGMNPAAKITGVKNANSIKTKREFEEFLRDAGFSKAAATLITSKGWQDVPGGSLGDDDRAAVVEAAKGARSIIDSFKVV